MEISKTKEAFLKKAGIDLERLPIEYKRIVKDYDSSFSHEEKDFLFSDSYSKSFVKPFRIKDVVGSSHPSYKNITFLEAFLKSKRGDELIEKLYSNPSYYSESLKSKDQSTKTAGHDTPIELNQDELGNCYIMGGNNRINLLMMLYLKEYTDAISMEDKNKVDEKYTFYGEIKSLPKNKEIISMIFMIKEIYENIKFDFIGNHSDDYHYLIALGDKQIEVTNSSELKEFFYQAYSIENLPANELYNKLTFIISTYIQLKSSNNVNRLNLMLEMCPELEEIKENFLAIRRINYSSNIFNLYDLTNINYANINSLLTEIKIGEENRKYNEDVSSVSKL